MKKKKKKKQNNFYKFLKKHATVITLTTPFIAFLVTSLISYHNKINSTYFIVDYFSFKIEDSNWSKKEIENSYDPIYQKKLRYPTINNEITKILNKQALKLKDYYVTYLIITQKSETEALNTTITLNKIDNDKEKKVKEKVPFSLSKDEGVKIPISICEVDKINYIHKKCILTKYMPIKINYNNKYWFSKKSQEIRDFNDFLIIEGTTLGIGGPKYEIPWYLRKKLGR